ncbi:MAG: hypothetical protein R3Y08_09150 [Rikenellaceae bacterium]
MKSIISTLTLITALLLTSCGGGTFDSKYFGKAPGVLNKNLEAFLEMSETKIKSRSEFEKRQKQIAIYEEEIEAAMPNPFVETAIETEVTAGLPYEITKAAIVSGHVSSGNDIGALRYMISMLVTTTSDMLLPHTVDNMWLQYDGRSARNRAYANVCYKFVDSKGDIIDQDKGYAIGGNRYERVGTRFNSKQVKIESINLPKGEQIEINVKYDFGDFSERELANNIKKADLDKIVFITDEEFDANQQILNDRNAAQ